MKLGAFSISLAVKDLEKSKGFYESLGFEVFAGSQEMSYLIMKNEETLIGLFQGMFENNILTFNPGWDQSASPLESFDDVRAIRQHLLESEIDVDGDPIESESGPASFTVQDPDGNVILIDQHR